MSAVVLALPAIPPFAVATAPPGRLSVEEVPVTATSPAGSVANNSPSLAADPTDADFVALAARTDGPDFSCTLHLSGDGGRGWLPARPVPRLPAGAEKCYAPDVAFDREGLLYYTFVGLHGLGNQPMGLFLTTSADRGRQFSPPRRLLGPHVYMVAMALDRDSGARGRIHLAWVQARSDPTAGGFPAADNPIMAAYSDDGGRTLSEPVRVSDRHGSRVVAPAVAIGRDGAVHVLYHDLEDDVRDYQGLEGPPWEGNWSLVVSTSTDGGRRFGPEVLVDDDVIPPERIMVIFTTPPPRLIADTRGTLVAAWTDARHGDWDVLLRRSADGGRTWAPAQRVNDDPPGNGRHQYLPALSLAPSGRLDAIFYDRREDPENLRNGVFHTSSEDRGRRFSPNVKLTSETSDSRIGVTFPALVSSRGLVEFGSRLGLVSTGGGGVAAWTDTRNAQPGQVEQDIFAATIRLPAADAAGDDRLFAVVAGAAVVGLVVTFALVRRRRLPGNKETAD